MDTYRSVLVSLLKEEKTSSYIYCVSALLQSEGNPHPIFHYLRQIT